MEKDNEETLFLIKRCIRRNIPVTDNALEHYGEDGKRVITKYENTRRKHEKALLYLSSLRKFVYHGLESRNVVNKPCSNV